MAKAWDEVRRSGGDVGEQRTRNVKRALEVAMELGDLRSSRNETQVLVGERMGVSQTRISRIERGDDLLISTLRGYVEALGGTLELVAQFDDDEQRIAVG